MVRITHGRASADQLRRTRNRTSRASRGAARKTIASRFIFELLWDEYLKDQASEMQDLYNLFSGSPITAVAAGWVFEFRMHQLLKDGRVIQLFPIYRSHPWVRRYPLWQLSRCLPPKAKLKTSHVAPISRAFINTRDEAHPGKVPSSLKD